MPFERIGPPEVEWGHTLCGQRHCVEAAQVLLDGWPLCILHADDEIERWLAFSLNPEAVELMPSLSDRSDR